MYIAAFAPRHVSTAQICLLVVVYSYYRSIVVLEAYVGMNFVCVPNQENVILPPSLQHPLMYDDACTVA